MQPDTLQKSYVFLVDINCNLTDEGRKAVNTFQMMTDETRISILDLLCRNNEKNVGEICQFTGHSQPAVSFHLAEMKEADMLRDRKEGRHRLYSIHAANNHFLTIAQALEQSLDMNVKNQAYGPLALQPLTEYPKHTLDNAGNRMKEMAKCLGFDIRIQILASLQTGSANVTQICKFFDRSQPDISHHLNILLEAGLLTLEEVGKYNYYSVSIKGKLLLQEFSQQLRRLGTSSHAEE